MRWPAVVGAVLAELGADLTLAEIFGAEVYKSGDRDLSAPSLEYTVVSDVETERFNPIRIQFDVLVRTDADLVAAEVRLRALFHHDLPTEIGGLTMWAEYSGSRMDLQGLPDGIRGSSTDYFFTPVRTRYVRAVES